MHNTVYYFFKSHLLQLLNKWTTFPFIINSLLESVFLLPYCIHIMPTKSTLINSLGVFLADRTFPDTSVGILFWMSVPRSQQTMVTKGYYCMIFQRMTASTQFVPTLWDLVKNYILRNIHVIFWKASIWIPCESNFLLCPTQSNSPSLAPASSHHIPQ